MFVATVCPVCESRTIRSKSVADLTLIGVCQNCQAVFTVQVSSKKEHHRRLTTEPLASATFYPKV
jgi:hypothetical protein